MNKRERFLAFAGFDPVDRVPRRAEYVEALRARMTEHLGRDPCKHFDMDQWQSVSLTPPEGLHHPAVRVQS